MSTTTKNEQLEAEGKKVARACQLFSTDVEHMSEADLARTCGGKSRCGFDLIFEVAGVLDFFADQIEGKATKGLDLSAGWPTAPEAFKAKSKAMETLAQSTKRFLEKLETYPGDIAEPKFEGPAGKLNIVDLAQVTRAHTMYHSGQLNYIQTILGDDKLHWF